MTSHRHSTAEGTTPADSCTTDCLLVGRSVGRRTFISGTVLAAAAAVLAACGMGSAPTSPFTGTFTVDLAQYPALAAVGGVALVSANGAPLAVVRTGGNSFVALSRICPHQGGTINPSSSGFLCTQHGARFDSAGTWVGGESTSSMRSYATSYDATAQTVTIG